MRVGDQYRTHPCSHTEGGKEVTVLRSDGKSFTYDRVKWALNYVLSILRNNDSIVIGKRLGTVSGDTTTVLEIHVEGELVWSVNTGMRWIYNETIFGTQHETHKRILLV